MGIVTKTLSLVFVSMVNVIWLTRRLTMPATVSKTGRFQFNPGSATRRNFPKRVITATSAVRTVKKLLRMRMRRISASRAIGIRITTSMGFLRCFMGWQRGLYRIWDSRRGVHLELPGEGLETLATGGREAGASEKSCRRCKMWLAQ